MVHIAFLVLLFVSFRINRLSQLFAAKVFGTRCENTITKTNKKKKSALLYTFIYSFKIATISRRVCEAHSTT